MIIAWVGFCAWHTRKLITPSRSKCTLNLLRTVVKKWVLWKTGHDCTDLFKLSQVCVCTYTCIWAPAQTLVFCWLLALRQVSFARQSTTLLLILEVNTNDLLCEIWLVVSEWYMFSTGSSRMTAKFTATRHVRVDWHFRGLYKHIPCPLTPIVNE